MQTYLIRHTKGPPGWAQCSVTPTGSPKLSAFEREWLEWMQEHDSHVVTIGETMLQIVQPEE